MKRHLIESLIIAIVATAGSYGLGLALGWVVAINWLEVFAVFTSYSCTWLCVRQRRINYPIGAASTAAYAILFFQMGLYASALLNLYLTPSLLYGWIRWRRDEAPRPVTSLPLKWWPVYLAATAAAYLGVLLIASALGATLPVTDSLILVGSILAQFLLDNKRIETWYVWVVVNVAAIFVYFAAGLPLAGFQYILFLINTVVGYLEWRKSKNATSLNMADDQGDVRVPESSIAPAQLPVVVG